MADTSSLPSIAQKNNHVTEVQHRRIPDKKQDEFYSDNEVEIDTIEDTELPGYLSKQYFPLYGMCFIVYLCSTMQGYNASLMGSIYTMKPYLNYYNLDVSSSSGTGLVFSIYNVGQICGAFFCSSLRLERKENRHYVWLFWCYSWIYYHWCNKYEEWIDWR